MPLPNTWPIENHLIFFQLDKPMGAGSQNKAWRRFLSLETSKLGYGL